MLARVSNSARNSVSENELLRVTYPGGTILVGGKEIVKPRADGWFYSFEAATGRCLWRFRVGPAGRRIHVYGKLLRYSTSYKGSQHTNLALMGPALKNAEAPARRTDRPMDGRRIQPQRKTLWQDKVGARYKGFIMTDDVLLAPGVRGAGDNATSSLAAILIKDGTSLWRKELPAPVVKAGLAIDSEGRIIAVLKNGKVVCVQ